MWSVTSCLKSLENKSLEREKKENMSEKGRVNKRGSIGGGSERERERLIFMANQSR